MELYLIAFTVIFGLIVLLVMLSDDDTFEYCNFCARRINIMEDRYYYRAYDTETKQEFPVCRYCANKYDGSNRYHIIMKTNKDY